MINPIPISRLAYSYEVYFDPKGYVIYSNAASNQMLSFHYSNAQRLSEDIVKAGETRCDSNGWFESNDPTTGQRIRFHKSNAESLAESILQSGKDCEVISKSQPKLYATK